MGLRARILAVVRETGPRTLNVLRGMARTQRQREGFEAMIDKMRSAGELVVYGSKRGSRWGAPGWRQRGFGYVEMAIILVVVVALAAGARWCISLGEQNKQAEWDAAKLQAVTNGQKRDKAIGDELMGAHKQAEAAQAEAEKQRGAWQEARRVAERSGKQLASCELARPGPGARTAGESVARVPAAENSGAAGVDRSGAIRLHWRFVGLHDLAFTGSDGKPLFEASAQFSGDPRRADAASPYGLQDLVDVHGANAMKQSECRRGLLKVKADLEHAAAAWDAAQRRD